MKIDFDIDEKDSQNGSTAIMHAGQRGNVRMVDVLLKKGASIADNLNNSRSALYFTVWSSYSSLENKVACIKLLVNNGANVDFGSIRRRLTELNIIDEIIPIKNTKVVLFDKNNEEYVIDVAKKENILISLSKLVIEFVKKEKFNDHDKKEIKIFKVCPSEVKVIIYQDNKEMFGLLKSKNMYIDIDPNAQISYHLLPSGSIIDGVKLTESVLCRFRGPFEIMDIFETHQKRNIKFDYSDETK